MIRLLFIILFLFPVIVIAQPFQLSGTIVNGENDKPVEGASVIINNASGGTVTSSDGNFA